MIRLGIDLGMTVIDTAEMCSNGVAEALVGEAIAKPGSEISLVDKLLPHHATRVGTVRACGASPGRLGVDYIDTCLLHWRDRTPLVETIEGFAELKREAMIRFWGISNLGIDDTIELTGVQGGDGARRIRSSTTRPAEARSTRCYRGRPNTVSRPWLTPREQGRLLEYRALQPIAQRHNATPAQIALAWVLQRDGVTLSRVPENLPTFGKTSPPEASS